MNVGKIKTIRKSKGITLKKLSIITGYTESYLSQIERGLKNPSLAALRKISKGLDVEIITFLVETEACETAEETEYQIIRSNQRPKVNFPTMEIQQELFTPSKADNSCSQKFLGFNLKLKKGESASEKMISHLADESVLIISGSLNVFIDREVVRLYQGDSIYIKSGTLHNYINDQEALTEIILFMF